MSDEFFKIRGLTIVIFMMISSAVLCQNEAKSNSSQQFAFSQRFKNSSLITYKSPQKYPSLSQVFSFPKIDTPSVFSQPKVYSYHHLAFFCKVEVQIEKAAKVPFKFRLGDVQYVDYLEQKIDSPK